jgi:serine/threonine protein kinase
LVATYFVHTQRKRKKMQQFKVDIFIEAKSSLHGQVHFGVECATKKPVAIKKTMLLAKGIVGDDSLKDAECLKLAQASRHPWSNNILRILHTETVVLPSGSWQIIVTERAECDLFEYIHKAPDQTDVPESCVRSLFLGAARGLCFVHTELNSAHLDVSLENLLVKSGVSKVVCLMDFGLARNVIDEKFDHTPHFIIGKRAYKAPEMFGTRTFDPFKADVWALGCCLFALLAGRHLCQTAHPSDKWFRAVIVKRQLDTYVRTYRPNCSEAIVSLLKGMLEEDPSDRFTMNQVLQHTWFAE